MISAKMTRIKMIRRNWGYNKQYASKTCMTFATSIGIMHKTLIQKTYFIAHTVVTQLHFMSVVYESSHREVFIMDVWTSAQTIQYFNAIAREQKSHSPFIHSTLLNQYWYLQRNQHSDYVQDDRVNLAHITTRTN
jgi:hypothetical protein